MDQTDGMYSYGGKRSDPISCWVSSGILGLVLGASGTFMVMQPIGPERQIDGNASRPLPVQSPTAAIGGEGVPATEMSNRDLRGGGGRGSRGAKRGLATLVGKLELLSRPKMKLCVEFDVEQAKAIATKLEELDKAESMFSEEAEENFYAIDRLLSAEQKEVIAEIGLSFDVGFGPVIGGPAQATGVSVSSGTSVSGITTPTGGGGRRDENPFTREVNQKRLRELLARLSPAAPEVIEKSE